MWTNSSNCSNRAGLTLIEVVASLGLLSTLLVGILIASDKHAEQIRRSRDTLDVLERVEVLLYDWMGEGDTVPLDADGLLPGGDDLVWKTRCVSTRNRRAIGVDVVRLEVFSRQDATAREPIYWLDLAVASSQWPPAGE